MILIFSQKKFEQSTLDLVDLLDHKNADFVRINGDDFIQNKCSFDLMHKEFITINNKKIYPSQVSCVFNRRWENIDNSNIINYNISPYNDIDKNIIIDSLRYEHAGLTRYFYSLFKNAIFIPKNRYINKLIVLNKAKKIGLKIPETLVTNSKFELSQFLKKNGKLITKSIDNIPPIQTNFKFISYLTQTVYEDDLNKISDYFYPSLFQRLIEKDFEIRTFYFFGICYSMAIFSQNDDQTKLDFRNYNYNHPNGNTPFLLPDELTSKIQKLFKYLNLNTGSIDIIYSKGQYYFLEINPVGQYGMVDYPCNYDLDNIIVDKLIEIDNGK